MVLAMSEAEAPPLSPLVGQMAAPGDVVLQLPDEGEVHIGPGLRVAGDALVSQTCGTVKQTRGGRLWVDCRQKRYIPAVGDTVVGIVRDRRAGEIWTVDINAPFPGELPFLAFENATRRNRPNPRPGAALYARVVSATKDTDPELSCTDAAGAAAGLGELKGGLLVSVSLPFARALVSKPLPPVLAALQRAGLAYQLAVGANGRVWVHAAEHAAAIVASQAIARAELLDAAGAEAVVAQLRASVGA